MASKLKTVSEVPEKNTSPVLVKAANAGRRELLVALRDTVAEAIDDGVPPHALARLTSEVERLDGLVREMDSKSKREASELTLVEEEPFNAAAI